MSAALALFFLKFFILKIVALCVLETPRGWTALLCVRVYYYYHGIHAQVLLYASCVALCLLTSIACDMMSVATVF